MSETFKFKRFKKCQNSSGLAGHVSLRKGPSFSNDNNKKSVNGHFINKFLLLQSAVQKDSPKFLLKSWAKHSKEYIQWATSIIVMRGAALSEDPWSRFLQLPITMKNTTSKGELINYCTR